MSQVLWSNEERRRNAAGLFDLPLLKDWLVWLVAVMMGFAVKAASESYYVVERTGVLSYEKKFSIEGNEVAFLIDCLIAMVINFVIFGVLPGVIRIVVRRKRPAQQPPSPGGWQQAYAQGAWQQPRPPEGR